MIWEENLIAPQPWTLSDTLLGHYQLDCTTNNLTQTEHKVALENMPIISVL